MNNIHCFKTLQHVRKQFTSLDVVTNTPHSGGDA